MAAPGKVSDAELEVLKALWDDGARTIRQLTDRLYPAGGAAHYATVQKLLERLESKGCVRSRRRSGKPNLYLAGVERRQLIANHLRETADRLCGGSLTPLLTHLVGHAELDADELDELRALVASAETKPRRRGP